MAARPVPPSHQERQRLSRQVCSRRKPPRQLHHRVLTLGGERQGMMSLSTFFPRIFRSRPSQHHTRQPSVLCAPPPTASNRRQQQRDAASSSMLWSGRGESPSLLCLRNTWRQTQTQADAGRRKSKGGLGNAELLLPTALPARFFLAFLLSMDSGSPTQWCLLAS